MSPRSQSPSVAPSRRPTAGGTAAPPGPRTSPEHYVCDQLRDIASRLRLSTEAITQLLLCDPEVEAHLGRKGAAAAVARLARGESVENPKALALIGVCLSELTGQPVDVDRVATRATRVRRVIAFGVAALLAPLCCYVVLGGLLTGQSNLMHGQSGVAATAAFLSALCLLGLLEALQISVTQLKTSDLAALRITHPRAFSLHEEFRTDHGLKRLLAGRQLVVVVTVFLVAGLSSFPAMRVLPGTSVATPGVLRPFLDAGVPGALFVLWFGQLAPQFVATQRALRLMNARIVGYAVRLALILESIGLAKPGFWLSSWDHSVENSPTSPALRWKQHAHEVEGLGVLTMSRSWVIAPGRSALRADTAWEVFGEGRSAILDGSITIPQPASALAMVSELRSADGDDERGVVGSSFSEEPLITGDRVLHKSAVPEIGAFVPGDVLVTRMAAEFESTVTRDAVLVERPSRALVWRASFAERPECLPPATVTAYRVGDGLADVAAIDEPLTLMPRIEPNGELVIEHTVTFPDGGTLFVFEWEGSF